MDTPTCINLLHVYRANTITDFALVVDRNNPGFRENGNKKPYKLYEDEKII